MTRGEEIRNAIDKIIPMPTSESGRNYEQSLMATGFESGVQWADDNPKSPWISVEEDLPCNHEELISIDDKRYTLYVVAVIHGIIILSRMYKFEGKWSWENDEPTHWMPIPELPKIGDKIMTIEKEIKENEIFEFEGTTLQAIETEDMNCTGCFFNYREHCGDIHCIPSERVDKKNVIFKEIK